MVGRLIDGRYEIRSRVARGGMATVYLAHDRRLDRDVALKVMHSHLADGVDGATFISRFRREARAAARLTHSGVVAVYDQGVDGEISYLTMEYVPGSNLRRELRRNGTLSVRHTFELLEQILAALSAAHLKNLIHRDIKPENALITVSGSLKVADFGLARAVTEVTSTTTGTILGTVAYLAPEVIATGACDARTDIYAVGILAYEMLTGTLPYEGTTPIQVAFQHVHRDVPPPSSVVPWLPTEIDDLITVFTARNPANRPVDGAAAADLLRRTQATLIQQHPEAWERQAEPPASFIPDFSEPETPEIDDVPFDNNYPETGSLKSIPLAILATTELDDGTTQPLPQRPTTQFASSEAPPPPSRPKARRRRVLAWVLPLLLLIGGGSVGAWWWFADGPGAWTQVPEELVGQPIEAVGTLLDGLDLAHSSTSVYDDAAVAGIVLTVDPPSGERIRRDGHIDLVVSRGIRMVTVPGGLVGLEQEAATELLRDAGLTVGTPNTEFRDAIPAGQVLTVSQEPNSRVPHNTVVTLTVSAGPEPVTVTQQTGQTREDAQAALEALGLVVTFADDEPSLTVPAGHVIYQSIPSGTRAHRTDTIQLTISSGPPMVAVPRVIDMHTDAAVAALEAVGFRVETRRQTGTITLDRVLAQDTIGYAPQGSTIVLTII